MVTLMSMVKPMTIDAHAVVRTIVSIMTKCPTRLRLVTMMPAMLTTHMVMVMVLMMMLRMLMTTAMLEAACANVDSVRIQDPTAP